MSAPDRAALRAHLVASRIAGDVATSREDNLLKYGMLAARLPKAMFGLEPTGRWNLGDILALMAERVGVSPDPTHLRGQDRIDPDLTIDALDRMAEHLARAARDRSRVLLATGHPAGLLVVHQAVAAALETAGATVLTPADGFAWQSMTRWGKVDRHIRYVGGVAVASDMGNLNHTHSAAADARPARRPAGRRRGAARPGGRRPRLGRRRRAGRRDRGRVRGLQRPGAVRRRGRGHWWPSRSRSTTTCRRTATPR